MNFIECAQCSKEKLMHRERLLLCTGVVLRLRIETIKYCISMSTMLFSWQNSLKCLKGNQNVSKLLCKN